MLNIKKFIQGPTTIQNLSNSIERQTEKQERNEIKIKFCNGEVGTYDKDRLLEIDFFKNSDNLDLTLLTLSNFDMKNFNAIVGIVIDKNQLSEVFDLDDYSNIFLYEDLIEGIKFLHYSSSEVIIDNLKKNYFPYLTLNQAKKITQSYQNTMKEHDVVPLAVSIAEHHLLMSYAFSSEEEASTHFNSILYYQMEINFSEIIIEKLKKCSQGGTTEAKLSSQKVSKLIEWIDSCKKNLQPLLKMMNPNTISMMGRQNFLRLLDSEDPIKQAIARKAEEELTDYKNTILKILELKNADLSREDLLPFLIGPNAFLLDEYNISYKIQKSSSGDQGLFWTHNNYFQQVSYSLEDTGPYSLEDNIRNDWLNDLPRYLTEADIPDRIIKVKIITKKISNEVKDFQLKSIPILKNWNNCSDDELMFVKNGIILLNNLNDHITHLNLKITQPSSPDFQTIGGFINCMSYSRPFEIGIDDFLLKIDNFSPKSSISLIEKMKSGKYQPPKSHQQLYKRG